MDERPANGKQRLMWSRGITWGVASAVAYVVLAWIVAFVLGDHVEDGALIIGFGIFVGVINGVTCALLFTDMPPRKLKFRHWAAVVAFAGVCGYALAALIDSLPPGGSFASGFVLVGLPLGYLAFKFWVSRSRGPKGHPDNIPS
jgi:cyanate permease